MVSFFSFSQGHISQVSFKIGTKRNLKFIKKHKVIQWWINSNSTVVWTLWQETLLHPMRSRGIWWLNREVLQIITISFCNHWLIEILFFIIENPWLWLLFSHFSTKLILNISYVFLVKINRNQWWLPAGKTLIRRENILKNWVIHYYCCSLPLFRFLL